MNLQQTYKKAISVSGKLPAARRTHVPSRNHPKLRLFESFEDELRSLKSESQRMENTIEKVQKKLKEKEMLMMVVDKNLFEIFEKFQGNHSNYDFLFEGYQTDKYQLLGMKNKVFEKHAKAVKEVERIRLRKEGSAPSEMEKLQKELENAEEMRDEILRFEKNEHIFDALGKVEEVADKYRTMMVEQFQPVFRQHNQEVEAEHGQFRKKWRKTVKMIRLPEFSGIQDEE